MTISFLTQIRLKMVKWIFLSSAAENWRRKEKRGLKISQLAELQAVCLFKILVFFPPLIFISALERLTKEYEQKIPFFDNMKFDCKISIGVYKTVYDVDDVDCGKRISSYFYIILLTIDYCIFLKFLELCIICW